MSTSPTQPLELLHSSGNAAVDHVVAGAIAVLDLHFAGRLSGHYFIGSCADGSLTPLSDIDLITVFKDRLSAPERQQFRALAAACKQISSRSLDIDCTDEATLLHADQLCFQPDWWPVLHAITLKLASLPAYGHDLRAAIPLVARDAYVRTLMHFPFVVLSGQRQHPAQLSYPLDYPDPSDEFFGYTGRKLRAADGTLTPSTKRLVHASGFIASALLALKTAHYVADKRQAIVLYRTTIGDEWADYLEQTHRYCRVAWGYQVPESAAQRELLRQLCQRELAFENYFLALYQDFLAQELHAADAQAREFARKRLEGIRRQKAEGKRKKGD